MTPQRPAEDLSGQRKQLGEERKKIEETKRLLDEQRKSVENKQRQVEEKDKHLAEMDRQLQRQKQQMDQLQASLQKAGGTAAAATELNKKLTEAEKKVEQAQQEAKRSGTEMERLLQLVQMSQEEQNQKEKQIMELQQALKNAQTKLKQQQQAQTQENEKLEEVELTLRNELKEQYLVTSQIEVTLSLVTRELKEKEELIKALKKTLEERDRLTMQNGKNVIKKNSISLENDETILSDVNDDKCKEIENSNCICKNRKLDDIIEEKNRRIMQLSDGLRESVQISTERERVLQQEESKRKQIMEKVGKLEQRLLSLQSAQSMRCHNCKGYVKRMSMLETKLEKLVAERKRNLQELTRMKREALEAAISEKDAHLALLEMSGIRNARQAEEVDCLKADKRRLVDMLKKEAECSISLLEESDTEENFSIPFIGEECPTNRAHEENVT